MGTEHDRTPPIDHVTWEVTGNRGSYKAVVVVTYSNGDQKRYIGKVLSQTKTQAAGRARAIAGVLSQKYRAPLIEGSIWEV